MKEFFRYNAKLPLTVALLLSGACLIAFGIFRLVHLLGLFNTVSFSPLGDIVTCAVIFFIVVIIALALLRSGYYFSTSLKAVLGITVFRVSYERIESLVRLSDGSLYLTVTEGDKKTRVKINIRQEEEADFLSALRRKKNDIIFETEN